MELFIILSVLYLPVFVWLSTTYVGYHKAEGSGDSKNKRVYIGFLLTLSSFHLISNTIFNIKASYGLPITVSIILLFSIYMLTVIVRDKQSGIVGGERAK
ncbi:hypothetical protein [Ureibacillus sinduriensis]|uniref:Uncharacterized protein n=1 Tax=Ureibacillus sinduriensis BLB-1 = JCM 15800 TaxID=1384057 RepID=A0A0A3I387_9BACL|nr:hypothetical protein [Ureibacillus sinduriensis]KGR77965.1 hypothetical protein CD33_01960 [Ureibacillus sinduriensis BLB-1 = JCM 15800]